MLKLIQKLKPETSQTSIIDMGGGCSNFLSLLQKAGYQSSNLYSSDLGKINPSHLTHELSHDVNFLRFHACGQGAEEQEYFGQVSYEDMQATSFAPEKFDVIVSLSVIEHGVDTDRFFREAN